MPLRLAVPLFAIITALLGATAVYGFLRNEAQARTHEEPAVDAHGRDGWAWPHGVPGFAAETGFKSFNPAQVEPLELQAAQLAAIRQRLDPSSVRVVAVLRPNATGLLAVLAATTYYTQPNPETSCLAVLLPKDRPVTWRCPGSGAPNDLAQTAVVVAAGRYGSALYVVGVARGDVRRVVLASADTRETVYTRGRGWGGFDTARASSDGERLLVFGRHGLLQVVPLGLTAGRETTLS